MTIQSSIARSIVQPVIRPATSFTTADFIAHNAIAWLDNTTIVGTTNVTAWKNRIVGKPEFDIDSVLGTAANLKRHPSGSALLSGSPSDFISTPDSSANSFAGSFDFRVAYAINDLTPTSNAAMFSKWLTPGSQKSFLFEVKSDGRLRFFASSTGANLLVVESTVVVPGTVGVPIGARVTWDSLLKTLTFFTQSSADIDSNEGWVQLGGTLSLNIPSLFNSSGPLEIGVREGVQPFPGVIIRAQGRGGGLGPAAVDFNPADGGNISGVETESFVSAGSGETWTLNGNTFIQNTGREVINSTGGVGLISTAEQIITGPVTIFCVAKLHDLTPASDQVLYDARTGTSNRMALSTSLGQASRFTMNQGITVSLPLSYNTDLHVFTARFNGGATSELKVSNLGSVVGNAGSNEFAFASLFGNSTGLFRPKCFISEFIVFPAALIDAEVNAVEKYLKAAHGIS